MSVTNVTIPTTQSFLLVDTRTGPNKVLFLPTASTIQGRYLSIKDYYGNATNSSVTISTTGLDRIDQRGIRYTLASSFGSVMLLSDGLRSWNMLGLYEGGDTAVGSVSSVNNGTVTATGGTVTTYGSNKVHTFTTVGTTTFTITSPSIISVTYLVVAGGGGGGVGRGGGGGGGGVLTGTTNLSAGSYTITVGAGGANAINDNQGGDGGSSSIGTTFVTTGGGGGGGWTTNAGRNGGSGGGASAGSAASGGTGVAGQGYAGAVRLSGDVGGGGGGAGAVASGSTGGIGISSTITGSTTYYAGGGGAGADVGGTPGVAYGGTYEVANGTYGGGNGANTSGTHHSYQDAVANTGGGGGGQEGYGGNSGAGGSGIVIIAYTTIFYNTWQYVRFTLVLTRGQYSGIFQISEFTLKYQGSVVSYTGASITPVVGGAEGTANIIDGSLSNKAFNIGSYFTIYRASGFLFNAYTWGTANDVPDRDPVRWIVDASQDNATWTVLDNKSGADQTITTSRNTYVQDFTF